MSINSISYSLPSQIEDAVREQISTWLSDDKVRRIWDKDSSVWTGEDEAKWLGWLAIAEEEAANIAKYHRLQKDLEDSRFTDVLLMGMGGSSLCPEVLAVTFDKKNFRILDSTVPSQVKAVEERLDLAKTLFIVPSKSCSSL